MQLTIWLYYSLLCVARSIFGYDECRDGECRNDLCDMLYADAMCMFTAIRVPVSLISVRVVPAWVSFGITTY